MKYLYKIHEVVQEEDNKVVIVPKNRATISDFRCDYMENRTNSRNECDLKILYDELAEDPENTRTYYYLAKTYTNMGDSEKAYEFYMKRINHSKQGFILELIDATFEAARTANFILNRPWDECEKLYLKSFELSSDKPEALYFIGIHYYLENNIDTAYHYLKKAFNIGYPEEYQFNLKPVISFRYIPKFLTMICYQKNDFLTGYKAAKLYLDNNLAKDDDMYEVIVSWYNIFKLLNSMKPVSTSTNSLSKPIFCFVVDGGFEPWSGSDILTKGVGGSETYIIEMARHIQKTENFQVYVFCNSPNSKRETFEGVEYMHLNDYFSFNADYKIHTCVVSRYSEYLPLVFKGTAENVYFVLHDLGPTGIVIPLDTKLKRIFCVSEWHVDFFTRNFPMLKDITVPFYHGYNLQGCKLKAHNEIQNSKIPYKFIYSSFPNRGLLPLLEMWSAIINKQPLASLHIYSDINGKWVNGVAGEQMQKIRELLSKYKNMNMPVAGLNIFYHGWVNKDELINAWNSSEFWL